MTASLKIGKPVQAAALAAAHELLAQWQKEVS